MHSQPEAGSQECVFGCIKYSMASMSEEVVLPLYLVLMQPQLEYCMILMIFECHFQITIQLFYSFSILFLFHSVLFRSTPFHSVPNTVNATGRERRANGQRVALFQFYIWILSF